VRFCEFNLPFAISLCVLPLDLRHRVPSNRSPKLTISDLCKPGPGSVWPMLWSVQKTTTAILAITSAGQCRLLVLDLFCPMDHLLKKNIRYHFSMLAPHIIYCTLMVRSFRKVFIKDLWNSLRTTRNSRWTILRITGVHCLVSVGGKDRNPLIFETTPDVCSKHRQAFVSSLFTVGLLILHPTNDGIFHQESLRALSLITSCTPLSVPY